MILTGDFMQSHDLVSQNTINSNQEINMKGCGKKLYDSEAMERAFREYFSQMVSISKKWMSKYKMKQ